jgi:hypothetical protein
MTKLTANFYKNRIKLEEIQYIKEKNPEVKGNLAEHIKWLKKQIK